MPTATTAAKHTPSEIVRLARQVWPDEKHLRVAECPLSAHPWTCWVVTSGSGVDLAYGETLDDLYAAVRAAKGE